MESFYIGPKWCFGQTPTGAIQEFQATYLEEGDMYALPQQEYRACEVYMYRFISEGHKYATKPEDWQLHPELQRLWEALEAFNHRLTGKD